MSYLIIQAGSTATRTAAGDYDQMFRLALGWADRSVRTVRVFRGESLPLLAGLRGIVITGSPAMVTDRQDWSERTADWLRSAVAGPAPILGVCYGHQLLAHALGGRVGDNPRGPDYGPVAVALTEAGGADPLLSCLPPSDRILYNAHSQSVLQAPSQGRPLAAGLHAMRFGAQVWGVQFYPEFTVPVMRGILEMGRDRLTREGLDVAARNERIDATGRRLLKRFAEICG